MTNAIMPVYQNDIQGRAMTEKEAIRPEMVRHTKASKAALDYLVEQLGDRFNKSDIIREAIIAMAEQERQKRAKQNK